MDIPAFTLGFLGPLGIWGLSLVFLTIRRAVDGLV